MAAIDCPRCGKPVMGYARFLHEAEPHRVSPCGHCGAPLARSRAVWLLLLVMSLALVGLAAAVARFDLIDPGTPRWISVGFAMGVLVGWVFLTNYLGYRLVGWRPAAAPSTTPAR